MHLRRLLAPSLKVLPAVVIVVAALFQVRTFGEMARSKPAPDAVTMLARADTRAPHELRRGRALEAAATRSKRELDLRDLATRAVR
jgi:hypothetical protein